MQSEPVLTKEQLEEALVFLNNEVQGRVLQADSEMGFVVKIGDDGNEVTLTGKVRITWMGDDIIRCDFRRERNALGERLKMTRLRAEYDSKLKSGEITSYSIKPTGQGKFEITTEITMTLEEMYGPNV